MCVNIVHSSLFVLFALFFLSFVCLSVSQMELCLASDVLCSKIPAVHRCATALLAIEEEEVNEDKNATSPSVSPSSPFSSGFLLFYFLLMALLYLLYCQLIA